MPKETSQPNEQPDTTVVGVGDFIEVLVARQTEFERAFARRQEAFETAVLARQEAFEKSALQGVHALAEMFATQSTAFEEAAKKVAELLSFSKWLAASRPPGGQSGPVN